MKTEELKIRIKELNDYFVNKLVNGEYEVVESDKFVVMVNIDGYRFNIWIGNGESNLQTYGQGFDSNFIELFFNEGQKSMVYKNLTRDEKSKMFLMEEIENKEKEIEQLKSKLNEL
jgi:hypothetical protein